ncbi:MAG: S8 family serine peptidase, partial [Anaerolineae bacterium]|nr:S8 family serine peptidase [Anaerolineae bacterium]
MRSVRQPASVFILKHTLRLVLVLSLLLAIGATSAQEITPEPTQPTDVPTEIPTDAGVTPTAAPTEAPPEIPTDAPSEIPTEVIPTVEPTGEPTQADVTPVPTEVVPTPAPQLDQFIEDFQDGETTGWLLTPNWAILTEDANAFLSTAMPQENALLQAVNWPYFSLVFKVRVDQGGTARVAFAASSHQFLIEIDAFGSLNLFQDSVLVGQSAGVPIDPAVPFAAAWRTVQVLVPGYVVAAKVDEFAPVSVTGLTLDGASGLSFGTGAASTTAVAYDDIVVTRLDAPPPAPTIEAATIEPLLPTAEVTPEATVEAEVTAEATVETTPEVTVEATVEAAPVLTTEALQKLPVPLQEMLMLVSTDDPAAVGASAASHFVALDEQGRLEVILWTRSETDAALIASEVQSAGGIVRESFSVRLTVQVTLEQLLTLVNRPEIGLVELPSRAVSTASQNGFIAGPLEAPTGPTATAGMDVIGASAWHAASTPVLGSGVDIVVIDTGFNAPVTTEHACLGNQSVVFGGPTLPTDTNHGMRVVEVLCDVAPSARVYMYKATNAATLASAINTANTNPIRIILITMDLGASISPGDGTGGGALYGIDSVYTAITNARSAGRTVIVSAGNNRGRYVTLNWNGTNSSVPMQVFAGDTIHVSWNDWSNTLNGATLENFGLSLTGDLNQTIRTGGSPRVGPPRQTYTVPAGSCVSGCNVNLVVNGFVGDPGNVIVQIQVAGQGTINAAGVTGSSVLTSAGTIGRPADSPDAIAVGAVCTDGFARFPLDPNSANGPVFGTGGAAPVVSGPFSRDQVKPDLVGPSHVSVAGLAANAFDCFDGSGFNGTSAAAAHVTGMVALMISNTNAGMVIFDGVSSLTVDSIQDYLQTRAIDLPFFDFSTSPQGLESTSILSDSFDMAYGAGLATLGSSTFNLVNSVNPLAAADTLPAACDASP